MMESQVLLPLPKIPSTVRQFSVRRRLISHKQPYFSYYCNNRSRSTSVSYHSPPLPLTSTAPSFINPPLVFYVRALSCDHEHRPHDHGPHHHHHHNHGHAHSGGELSGAQGKIMQFAKSVGWAGLADRLRENLHMCCCSMALLLMASLSGYLVPAKSAKFVQGLLVALAFPLVGVEEGFEMKIEVLLKWLKMEFQNIA